MVTVLPTVEDVHNIAELIGIYSKIGIVISRTPEDISKNLSNFRVIKDGSKLLGCVSLHAYSQDLAELRTLVVDSYYQGIGVGSLLVESIKTWAEELEIKKLFTLTVEVDFFLNRGFQVIDMSLLPDKIFKDCQYCKFKNNCQETALWITI